MTKLQRVVRTEYRDSDGYWIEFKPGWHDCGNTGVHGIVEDTKAEARRKAKYAVPCDCEECLGLIAKGTRRA